MIDSNQVLYIARSGVAISMEELVFHLSQLPTVESQIANLRARGYTIVGYIPPHHSVDKDGLPGMYDLDGNFMPGEGMKPGDLALQGEKAHLLLPKDKIHKIQRVQPTKGEGNPCLRIC